jgi:sec-independent protein translocase protein TatA
MGFSAQHLLIVLLVAVVLFGSGKLPQIGEGLGQAIRNFKKAANDLDEVPKKQVDKDDKNT